MAKTKGTVTCGSCAKVECRLGYPAGQPVWCEGTKYQDILDSTKGKYASPEDNRLYLASAKVVRKGFMKWPRVKEAIELCKELKVKKVGLASCVGLTKELELITELFEGAGFEVISSACQIGRIMPEDRGVRINTTNLHGLMCNPIAQAEICNFEGTEFNYIIGLCLGHDILFTRHSKAPVSTLIVKDRVTGHNPAAALHISIYKRPLWKEYCNVDLVK